MELKTRNEHIVKLKKDITGGEYQDIQDVLMSSLEMSGIDETGMKISGSVLKQQRDKKIEVYVVSVDEKTNNILDRVRNLPAVDYNDVIEKIEELHSGIDSEKKTK